MKAEENFVKDMDTLRKALNEPATSISMPKRNTLADPVYRSICKRAMGVLDNIELMRKEIIDPKAYEQVVQPSIKDLELLYMEWWRTCYGPRRYDLASEFFSILEKAIPSRCPKIGVGFKAYKVLTVDFVNGGFTGGSCCPAIATIWIPENAQRSSAFGAKCRADEIQITDIAIKHVYGERHVHCGRSPIRPLSAGGIIFSVGSSYHSTFNSNRWEECADGIHFFMTEKEAIKFSWQIGLINPPSNIITAEVKEEEDYV